MFYANASVYGRSLVAYRGMLFNFLHHYEGCVNMYRYILWAAYFLVGASIESAINCAVYRMRRGVDWVGGHSVCEGCLRRLRWWELIPVFSSLFLRGSCPRCGVKFGYKHAVTEAVCGICFMFVLGVMENTAITVKVAMCSLLILMFVCLAFVLDNKAAH